MKLPVNKVSARISNSKTGWYAVEKNLVDYGFIADKPKALIIPIQVLYDQLNFTHSFLGIKMIVLSI